MFLYFALPVLAGVRMEPITAAILAIIVNAGAYIAEIVRGAFLSIPKGLTEAGLAIGLPQWKVLLYIVGPLAFRRLIPPLGNQFIVSLKDTELRKFPNIDNAYLELRTGGVDAAMHDTPNVLYYIATAGEGAVKAVGEQMMAHEYGIGFPKGSELTAKVNVALANMKADGRYDAIYEKWFGTKPAH